MKKVEDFVPFIIGRAPDIPDSYIEHAIREAINYFMRMTRVAVDDYQFEFQKKVDQYALDIPDCRRLLGVRSVAYSKCGGVLTPDWFALKNTPDYTMYEVITDVDGFPYINIYSHIPDRDTVNVRYEWSISRDGCEIPDFIYEDYINIIADLALSNLYMLPNVEWANAQIAAVYSKSAQSEITKLKIKKWGGVRSMKGRPIGGFSRRRFL